MRIASIIFGLLAPVMWFTAGFIVSHPSDTDLKPLLYCLILGSCYSILSYGARR